MDDLFCSLSKRVIISFFFVFFYSHANIDVLSKQRNRLPGKTALLLRSDLSGFSNSVINVRRMKSEEKRRQKEEKYFYNSVMEQQRRKPRPTAAVCKNFPGLNKKQLELCFRYPDVMAAAIQGLQMAVSECQFQFQKHRWNCSVLERKNRNPQVSPILQKGNILDNRLALVSIP